MASTKDHRRHQISPYDLQDHDTIEAVLQSSESQPSHTVEISLTKKCRKYCEKDDRDDGGGGGGGWFQDSYPRDSLVYPSMAGYDGEMKGNRPEPESRLFMTGIYSGNLG